MTVVEPTATVSMIPSVLGAGSARLAGAVATPQAVAEALAVCLPNVLLTNDRPGRCHAVLKGYAGVGSTIAMGALVVAEVEANGTVGGVCVLAREF